MGYLLCNAQKFKYFLWKEWSEGRESARPKDCAVVVICSWILWIDLSLVDFF